MGLFNNFSFIVLDKLFPDLQMYDVTFRQDFFILELHLFKFSHKCVFPSDNLWYLRINGRTFKNTTQKLK